MHDVVSSGTLLQGIVYLRKGKFERKKKIQCRIAVPFFSRKEKCACFFLQLLLTQYEKVTINTS